MKKTISIILIIMVFLNLLLIPINSYAVFSISEADLYSKGQYDDYLRWEDIGIIFNYVVYKSEGKEYPAYCLDKDLEGATVGNNCSVSIKKLLTDVKIWRTIINGYPYKTYQELGCNSKEEAYIATKQAVYCAIYNRNVNTYSSTDARSKRVLKALKQIVENAENSKEVKASSKLTINQENSKWEVDAINKKYVSKTFFVTANSSINSYSVDITKKEVEGILITDEKNNEKQTFESIEKFKILVPIQNMLEKGTITIKTQGEVATKPILYGSATKTGYQDYALTGKIYEDGEGEKTISYNKNETQIIIIKQAEESNEPLKGVSFQLLDENKEIIHTDLITNEEGKIVIENLIPGNYYLKETSTVNGFNIYDELIPIELELNKKVTININNSKEKINEEEEKKEEIVNIKAESNELKEEEEEIKEEKIDITVKLPKTGY